MKKTTLRFFLVLLFLVTIVALQSCMLVNNNDNKPPSHEQENSDSEYFDWSNLNYAWTEQEGDTTIYGYATYDVINFSGVSCSKAVDANSVYFEIYFDGEQLARVDRMPNNTFKSQPLLQKGSYDIKIFGKTTTGVDIYQQFSVGVKACGRPDNVEITIKNSSGEVVEYVKGGDTYTFLATIYSDGQQIDWDSKNYFWEKPSNAGKKEYQYTIGNQTTTQIKEFDFNCFVHNNMGEKVNIFDKTFEQRDNLLKTEQYPEGIYYDYGMDIVNNRASLYLNLNQSPNPNEKYFYSNITAEYRFENGDVQPLEYSSSNKDDAIYLLVSYDNLSYKLYDIKDYDYSKDIHGNRIENYFANGVKYQFEPSASSAKIQLCRKLKRTDETGTIYYEKAVEKSAIDIDIIKQNSADIEAKKVSGKHKNDNEPFATTYKEFSQNIANDVIELYVFCDMNGSGVKENDYLNNYLSSSNQYFVIEVADMGGSLWDYTIDFDYKTTQPPIRLVTYRNDALGIYDQYFVCLNYGNATINVQSSFGKSSHSFDIKVVDKIFYNSTEIDKESLQDYGLFSHVNVESFVKLKEYRLSHYNKNSAVKRGLQEGEYLEYYIGNNQVSANNFDYANNGYRGQELRVYLRSDFINKDIYQTMGTCYSIPNFRFLINGKSYLTTDLGFVQYSDTISCRHCSDNKYFFGNIWELNYTKGEQEIVDNYSFAFDLEYSGNQLEQDSNDIDRFLYEYRNGVFVVFYKFYYTHGGQTHIYQTEILRVNVN